MQLVYGSYFHEPNSVSITSWQRSHVLSENQWPKFLKVSASFRFRLLGDQPSLMAQAQTISNAYSVNGLDLNMFDNSGNYTVWSLANGNTVGGILVTNPVSWSNVQGAQAATYLDGTVSLEGLVPLATNLRILSFQESITFDNVDGGPIQVERIPAVGWPIIQNVTERSFYYAFQEGMLTSGAPDPQPMDPIWPALQRRQPGANKFTKMAPKTIRGVPHEYGVRWSYQFVSDSPIFGTPNIR
jgi:hypothetical protein